MESYVLDTYALIQYFKGEPGGLLVKDLLKSAEKGEVKLYVPIVNVVETYYIVFQKDGEIVAGNLLARIKRMPLTLVEIDDENIILTGRCKATKKVSFADSFVVGCAIQKNAIIVTGDPEFSEVADIVQIKWLPQKAKI
ncbi:MAG: type II toxin-antitoxin system VapC family toxin [bacterium]